MKKAKFAGLTSILVLGAITVLIVTVIKTNAAATPHMTVMKTPAGASRAPSPTTAPPRAAISVVMPGHTATPLPKVTPTREATTPTHTTTSTQAPTTLASSSGDDRYFPAGTSATAMKSMATNLTKQQVKTIIEKQVDANWGVIQSALGFGNKGQAYAFFLGMATRESTLNAGLETGSGAAHSYGPLQASETAYTNANPSYTPENDVPLMVQYTFTPQNFYDPGIAVHMGIRHLIHFAHQSKAAGFAATDFLRHALIGYNTGWVTTSNQSLLQQYSDEIGALAGWYLTNGHLYDNAFTWTGSQAVNRGSPWGWY
jgi:hypothetical protein